MNSRDRIIAALKHEETDRIPVDLGATESSGITWIAYNNLKKYLGINTETKVYDLAQLIVLVEEEVLKIIGADAVPLIIGPKKWKDWEFRKNEKVAIPEKANLVKLENGDTVIVSTDGKTFSRLPKDGYYFDTVFHPLEKANSLQDISGAMRFLETFDWPGYCDEDYTDLHIKAKKLYEETDFAIVGNLLVHVLAAAQELRGFGNFMVDILANKKFVNELLEKLVEAYLPRIDKYIEAVGPYLNIIEVNDDLGTQTGLQMKPEVYREMIKPHHKKLWQYIKGKSGGKPLLLHSCGSIYELIPDIIEMGIDAINPVQVSAAHMDTARLKREYGKYLTFWGGGCDTQEVLPRGSANDVKREVRKRINDLSGGGGFVFCQVHNIQPDVVAENILAMYEEAGTLNYQVQISSV